MRSEAIWDSDFPLMVWSAHTDYVNYLSGSHIFHVCYFINDIPVHRNPFLIFYSFTLNSAKGLLPLGRLLYFQVFCVFPLAAPTACRSSWPGIEPMPQQWSAHINDNTGLLTQWATRELLCFQIDWYRLT